MARINPTQDIPNEELYESDPKHVKLKETCREFEAVMVSLVLKEGLNGASEMGKVPGVDDDEDSGTQTFKQFAYEQMSYCVGKTGMIGLGDRLYESMKDKLASQASTETDAQILANPSGRRMK